MNEITALVEAFDEARARGERCALATVVRVEGSAYRRPGARMILTESGRATGLISGGCLEGDVRERAARVMETGRAVLVRYDTTSDDDAVWGLGLGCNGIVDVLIEPATDGANDLMRFLDRCSTSRGRSACATVFRSDTSDLAPGARVLLSSDGVTSPAAGAHAADNIIQDIVADLHRAVRGGTGGVARYGRDAAVEVLIEVVEPRVALVIFGAGPDAVPLVTVARHFGWHTTVVDTHARSRSVERFRDADAVILSRPERVTSDVTLTESSVVVLMTHSYPHDLELLPILLNSPARYIGCLGPKRRTERLLSELQRERRLPHNGSLARLHAPVGLDVGAETPSEIAVSIGAEILAVVKARSGGFLRHREGSIHGGTHLHAVEDLPAVADVHSVTDVACQPVSA